MSALRENKRWLAGIEYNPDVIMSKLVNARNVYHHSHIKKPVLLLMI